MLNITIEMAWFLMHTPVSVVLVSWTVVTDFLHLKIWDLVSSSLPIWLCSEQLLLLNPPDTNLQMNRYVQIYTPASIHFYNNILFPHALITLTVVSLQKQMDQVT